MNTKPITEFNTNALTNISTYLEFSQFSHEPVTKEITFSNYSEIGFAILAIFSAIEMIGFNGEKADLSTCAGLAEIGKKLVPLVELEFLDNLLIKEKDLNPNFKEIKKL